VTRVAGWETALVRVIEAHSTQPFSWGGSSCFAMADDAIEAVRGESSLRQFCTFKTEAGAAKRLKRTGFADIGDLFASLLPEIPPSLAQRGDIGVILREGVLSAGIFTSFGFASKAEHGVIYEPITAVSRAFKVD
jgi:hypothetical protein